MIHVDPGTSACRVEVDGKTVPETKEEAEKNCQEKLGESDMWANFLKFKRREPKENLRALAPSTRRVNSFKITL